MQPFSRYTMREAVPRYCSWLVTNNRVLLRSRPASPSFAFDLLPRKF